MQGISRTDFVAGHILQQVADICEAGAASGEDDTAAEVVLQAALLDVVEHCVQNFAATCVDNLGNVLHADFLDWIGDAQLKHFLAERAKLGGDAGAEADLDLFSQGFGNRAFAADIPGDVPSAERNGGIAPHNTPGVDTHRCYARADIDQSNAVLLLILIEHGLGHDVRKEILLRYRNAQRVENLVHRRSGEAVADEHLERSGDLAGNSADHIVLHHLDLIVDGERLGHRAVHDLLVEIVQRICLQRQGLEVRYLLLGDELLGVGPVQLAFGNLLLYVDAGETHHHLQDLDHKFGLGILDGLSHLLGCLPGILHKAVAYSVGRSLLVVHDLDVIPFDAGNAKPELGSSQVNRCYVSFFHIYVFICYLHTICPWKRRSTSL